MVLEIQLKIKRQLSELHSASGHGLNISSLFLEPLTPTEGSPFSDPNYCGVMRRIVCQCQQKDPPNNRWDVKVFVRNINFKTQRKTLKSFLEKFGPVRQIRFLHKDGGRRSRGMAIVHFKDKIGVQQVLNATPEELICDNRELYVQQAEWKRRDGIGMRHEDTTCPKDRSHPIRVHDPEVDSDSAEWDRVCCLPDRSGDPEDELTIAQYGRSHINSLPDDVILHIFSFLSLRQTIAVDRVCQKWRNLSLKTWQTLKRFQMADLFTTFKGPDDRLIKRLLGRTNPACLDSLNLSYSVRSLKDATAQVIGQLCPNLHSLDLSASDISNKGLRSLAEQCCHLLDITLDNCHSLGEDGLWWLFHRCKELQRVSLENNKRLKGPCLHVLGQNIKVLNLNGCSKLKDVGLGKLGLSHHDGISMITELKINDCGTITDTGLDKLTSNCPTLQKLHLGGVLANVTSEGVSFISRLRDLSELHLVENAKVNDGALAAICNGCSKLCVLDLTGCSQQVTDVGIKQLAACPHLAHLTISYLHRVSNEAMLPIYRNGQLRKLVVRGCTGLTDLGMGVLATECCHLAELDVSGCFQLGPATLQCFVEAAPTRVSVLTVTCGGTSFEDSDEGLTPDSAVRLVKWNYANMHLWHDRDFLHDGFVDADGEPLQWMDPEGAEDFLDNDDPLAVWDLS